MQILIHIVFKVTLNCGIFDMNHFLQSLMWIDHPARPDILIILVFFYSTDSFELNKFNWNQQLTQISQWIHLDSSMNSLGFLNEITRIPQWIHQNPLMN